jgi:hypothetical protein
MPEFTRVVGTKEEAYQAVCSVYEVAKLLLAEGRRVRLHVREEEDDITIRQRGFLHAAVLPQIAEQVVIEGVRYTPEAWKELLRQLFLPDRFVMVKRPRWDKKLGRIVNPRKARPERQRQSTEDLGIKGYSEFIDKSIAHATTEWGVQFVFIEREREAVRYRPTKKKAATKELETC